MKLKEVNLISIQLFERQCREDWINDKLWEMANIHPRYHGIDNVVIWVGIKPGQHGLRVKVSNRKNRFDHNDDFVIRMPSLDYDPKRVAKWITTRHLEKIMAWIKLNYPLLAKYESGKIDDTGEFLDAISPV